MLELKNIKKDYPAGSNTVAALNGISIKFRQAEFVSVLGPSGCGKTTLLNIIGGLDRYTSGDLIINGRSTKEFKDPDWDAYRNRSIGFVFQNYNLIPHLTVLGNVEIAMTLSGVSKEERRKRAVDVLTQVGLSDQLYKRPNQLSGGQMQRVAIARSIVNNPDILLADEPTGALDSNTSVQIMELLKEISKDRLVIMVTHNGELANTYSTRIIRLLDGKVVDDTNPLEEDKPKEKTKPLNKQKRDKTRMTFFTALSLSFKNLLTKKGRTFITAFAGSIGIIGVALVLAVSNGFTAYINSAQSDTLAEMPISISRSVTDYGSYINQEESAPNPNDAIYPYTPPNYTHYNIITQPYIDYVNALNSSLYSDIKMRYGLEMNIVSKITNGPITHNLLLSDHYRIRELSGKLSENERTYEKLYGSWPVAANELVLIADSNNQINSQILTMLGIPNAVETPITFSSVIGKEYRLIPNETLYQPNGSIFDRQVSTNTLLESNIITVSNAIYNSSIPLTIVGVIKVKSNDSSSLLDIMDRASGTYSPSTGLAYSPLLTEQRMGIEAGSALAAAALTAGSKSIISGSDLTISTDPQAQLDATLAQQRRFGANNTPSSINIFPKDFDSKSQIKTYLAAYNADKTEADRIFFSDLAESITSMMGTVVDAISYVLIVFAGISLVVSTIMISIITYVSVIERTKEIGVLRAIGARKRDVSRVFNAETIIIGFTAGIIGILVTAILTIPINLIVTHFVPELINVAQVAWWHVIMLVTVSTALTLLAGLIPSRFAAKKDPVAALRSE